MARRDNAMTLPHVRITIRRLMGIVAIAGWITFNGRPIHVVIGDMFPPMPTGLSGRVILFTALAWLIGPAVGVAVAFGAWSDLIKYGRSPIWSGLVAGSAAGFAGWGAAGMLMGIAQGNYVAMVLGGLILGLTGVLINLPPAMLMGAPWGWRHRHRGGQTGRPVGQ
jgi:hypothetical protein